MALRLVCPICQESMKKDQACVPCGHIFHNECIDRWLREPRREPSCPQCRQRCTRKQIIRLYVEESADLSVCEDIGNLGDEELQDALSAAKAALKTREQEIEEMHQTVRELKDDMSALRQRSKLTAEELGSQKSRASSLQKQLTRLLPLEEECVNLRKQVQDFRDRHTIVEMKVDDVSDMLERYGDGMEARRRMAVCLVSLKREYECLKRQRKEATDMKDRLAKQLAVERAKLHQAEANFSVSKKRITALENDIQQMEEEKSVLMGRIELFENVVQSPSSKHKLTRFTDSSFPAKRPCKPQKKGYNDGAETCDDEAFSDLVSYHSPPCLERKNQDRSSTSHFLEEGDSDSDTLILPGRNPRKALSSLNNTEDEAMPLPVKSRTGASSSADLHVHRMLSKKLPGGSSVRHGFNGFGGHSRFMPRMKASDKQQTGAKRAVGSRGLVGATSLSTSHAKQQTFQQVRLSSKENFLDDLPDLPALGHFSHHK